MRPLAHPGGPDGEVRAGLVAAQLTGFATLDQMIQTEAFAGIERERLAGFLTEFLDHFIG